MDQGRTRIRITAPEPDQSFFIKAKPDPVKKISDHHYYFLICALTAGSDLD